ncbi:MAG: acyl carrier protein [Ruminiclostridium sp.]|nr:acyl carrier protein [Ruminiclostridium sp.]MBQ8411892.1 acyl carrier protein [Ruminiclostridium sp.]MBQ8843090.1 acyl carrier protein [Ruminiclostridium sp.]
MEEIFERLNEVFRDFFDDEDIELDEETTADDIDDWDSLNHITLMAAVEDEFGIRFTMGEVSGMKNVGEMADIIKSRM